MPPRHAHPPTSTPTRTQSHLARQPKTLPSPSALEQRKRQSPESGPRQWHPAHQKMQTGAGKRYCGRADALFFSCCGRWIRVSGCCWLCVVCCVFLLQGRPVWTGPSGQEVRTQQPHTHGYPYRRTLSRLPTPLPTAPTCTRPGLAQAPHWGPPRRDAGQSRNRAAGRDGAFPLCSCPPFPHLYPLVVSRLRLYDFLFFDCCVTERRFCSAAARACVSCLTYPCFG